MPRRHRHRRRTMRGGFLDTLSSWGSSLSQGASSMWQKTKDATSSATSGFTSSSASTTPPPTTSAPMTTTTYGGKHRRSRKRHMRGGFRDNTPTTGLAAHAAPFSGPTAQPHNWVGGRTRRRRGGKHRHNKSCRHRRH